MVLTCARLLRRTSETDRLRLPTWADWATPAQAWTLGSVLLLGALTVSGAGA